MSILSRQHRADALWPATAAEASAMAAEAAGNGTEVVVAMGGDGMVHHVAQGLVGTTAALGIIPVGTTNVIARLLDVPSRHTKAARLIARQPTPQSVGVAAMTLVGEEGGSRTHHAIFACGVGLDAEVVEAADGDPYRKYRFGSIHYMRSAVGVALGKFARVKPHITVTSGERVAEAATVLVQFRQVYTYFGRLPIRLNTSPPEPMTVLTLDRLRRSRVPQIAFDALTGRDLSAVKGVHVWEGVEHVLLATDIGMSAQADGEALGKALKAIITWRPDALLVVAGD
jgi:diacylglycerol kinase family enzyme